MSRIHDANREIVEGLHRRWRAEADRRRELKPIRVIDDLIADLEELHLLGRKRVPESFSPRLASLAAALPEHLDAEELRSRITIVHLMDRLYDVQDILLRRKRGHATDEDLPEAS